ncbi:MAG: HAD hydrolase-like protein [Betaproteobacteria bacterium]
MIDALFFDLDGTLTDNHAGISGCIAHALDRMGAPAAAPATLRDCIGPPLRETFGRLLATNDALAIEAAIAFYRERFEIAGWSENEPYAGIHDTLAVLAGQFRLFVCTAKPQRYAERIIDHFELRRFFAGVYGPDMGGRLDDKRALLQHALAAENVTVPRAVMIGDRAQDMRAGRSNRLGAIGVLYGYGSADELSDAGAEALCDTVDALPAVVALRAGRKIELSS